jgi:hypothetical protein
MSLYTCTVRKQGQSDVAKGMVGQQRNSSRACVQVERGPGRVHVVVHHDQLPRQPGKHGAPLPRATICMHDRCVTTLTVARRTIHMLGWQLAGLRRRRRYPAALRTVTVIELSW